MPARRRKADRPQYRAATRELWLGDRLVKRYRVRAENQELMLKAFEEEGWPQRIDDPLPPHPDIDSHERLKAAIKRLNKAQKSALIHFSGDGTGRGILWSLMPAERRAWPS
jgi:hypothetical protein